MAESPTFDPPTQHILGPADGSEEAVGVPFPVVGVGASAGGLDAFTALLRTLPVDTGMAFVFVQHISPDHTSSLAEILSRSTKLPVAEVHDDPALQPNRVYVMPADRNVEMVGGVLRLIPREDGPQRPIDRFFRSLAESQKHLSIGVVLSGTATDGTIGLQAIQSHGGITFAQDETALHDGMPHSAIASGSVDFILPPQEIAKEIARIGKDPKSGLKSALPTPEDGASLEPVLRVLHQATGVDFTSYKANTLHRRVTRRMVLQKVGGARRYADLLRKTPAEVDALYQDILISVTSFFRDPDGFQALKETAFPRLIANRSPDEPLRIWSLGCSTGEEAYSLAMAFEEFSEAAGIRVPLQIFATDLNSSGIEKARAGVYTKDIARDVSPERLRRFFSEVGGGYRIKKFIRESCVFSRHNALSDPPFSRIDLISCRNLLIYIEQVLQERIMPVLHYALKPSGFLWLGGSETIGRYRELFDTIDARHRIYAKRAGTGRPAAPTSPRHAGTEGGAAPTFGRQSRPDLHQEADRVVLSKFAPPGVLVSPDMNILQFRGDTSAYLAAAPGRASLNLWKMLRQGLMVGVRAAFQEAVKEGTPARREGLRVRSNEGWRVVSVEVVPIGNVEGGERGFLVLFEPAGPSGSRATDPGELSAPPNPSQADQEIARLTEELNTTREYLQSVIEQQDASNEELQTANEEVQSSNEELQSTNEELETSKEEIQSSNEELITVNEELNNSNRELARVNDDLINVLDSVKMPIILLGPDFRIRRFTHTAEKVWNVVPADVGRPIGAIKLHVEIPDLEAMLTEVFQTVSMREREVRDRNGHWYSLRVRPYRTTDDRIDGVVMMLVDIERLKRIQEYTDSIIGSLRGPILVLNGDLRVRTANRSFYETFGISPLETEDRLLFEIGNGQWDIPELRRLLQDLLTENRRVEDFEIELDIEGLGRRTILLNARTLIQPSSEHVPSILLAMEDITGPARAKRALQESAIRLQEGDRHKNEFLAMLAHELRNPLAPIGNAMGILRLTEGKGAETITALDVMERQIGQMVRFVDDLLDASRMNLGRIDFHRRPIDLSSALSIAVEATTPLIHDRNQQLKVTMPSRPLYVDGDPTRLAQAVGNLLNNASKFTETRGRIRLTAEREGDQAVIRVQDEGIGMAADQLPRIFDLFMQADTSLERTRTGLGIGLTLVKIVAEMHGGTVEAKSPGLGQGSEFVLRLPAQVGASEPATEPPVLRKTRAVEPHRILVVDDNRDAAESLTVLLRLSGHKVLTAYDGLEAVGAAESFRPDVALLDIGMPQLNGYEVARRIREQPWGRKMTLVAVSGWGQDEDRRKAREAGFDAHVVKPVNYDVLTKLLGESPVRE